MTSDKGILIKNIYYMLTYAFQVLNQSNYESVAAEEFDDVQDLFAAILSKGVAQQLKQGLHREYITQHDTLSVLHGKLDMPETLRCKMQHKQKLACEFDELFENNLLNQILKTTMYYLLRDSRVKPDRKNTLKKTLVFFETIDLLNPFSIHWNRLQYQRNNRSYEMLINICYFVLEGMLQTTENGDYKVTAFSDQHMAKLFEKFVLEYYRRHHSYLSDIRAAQVKWNIIGDSDDSMIVFLPDMQTDITLQFGDKVLIIDTKYYGHMLQQQYDKLSLHSGNVYQIFTYVKNMDKGNTGNVSGLLLYAKTEESVVPDCSYNIGGNQIAAKTLDLNTDFKLISEQLDQIIERYFGEELIQCGKTV